MEYLLIAILGGLSNKYRGGLFHNRTKLIERLPGKYLRILVNFLTKGKVVNALIWACFTTFIVYGVETVTGEYRVYGEHYVVMFILSFILMWRYSAPGWGAYIQAIHGLPQRDGEVQYIDEIIEGLGVKSVKWGIAGLSIRCFEWGFMIGAPFVYLYGIGALTPALAGLLIGPISYACTKISLKHTWLMLEVILGIGFFLGFYIGVK